MAVSYLLFLKNILDIAETADSKKARMLRVGLYIIIGHTIE